MRLFWIIVGIVVLVWLGFLHFDRNEIRLDLDKTNHRIDGVEQKVSNDQTPKDDLNVGEEVQDEAKDAQEEIQQGIPTKKEQAVDEAKDKKEELKEQKMEKQETKDEKAEPQSNQPKDVETSLPPIEPTSFAEEEAIVAFNLEYTDDTHVAFKQLDTPILGDELTDAYLNLDPMILSLK